MDKEIRKIRRIKFIGTFKLDKSYNIDDVLFRGINGLMLLPFETEGDFVKYNLYVPIYEEKKRETKNEESKL